MAVTTMLGSDRAAEADEVLHRVLATPEGQADPYPLYRRLRDLAPVHRSGLDGVVYVTSFDGCKAVLGDPRIGKSQQFVVSRHGVDEERVRLARRRARPSMITSDPPEHTRLRGVAKGAFIPPSMEALRPRVARLVDERLDRLVGLGSADVMTELAFPLPVTVIGELVGVPEEDRDWFRPLVATLLSSDQPNPTPELLKEVERAGDDLEAYFFDLIKVRRAKPEDDLLSDFVAQRDAGVLTDDELFSTVVLLFLAGFLTTTNLIGNGLLALFHHPVELRRLLDDPTVVPGAVEEMLRYDTPIQLIHRTATGDTEVGGTPIAKGDIVFTLLGAANRDPARFAEPDRFDATRPDNLHVAFAWGLHFCLGARLARMEGQLVFDGLARRFSNLELDSEPQRRPGLVLRAVDRLDVTFTPR